MLSFRLFIKKVGRIIVYQNISAKYFSKPQLNSYTDKALLSQIESKAFLLIEITYHNHQQSFVLSISLISILLILPLIVFGISSINSIC